jgi:hypothetical protein
MLDVVRPHLAEVNDVMAWVRAIRHAGDMRGRKKGLTGFTHRSTHLILCEPLGAVGAGRYRPLRLTHSRQLVRDGLGRRGCVVCNTAPPNRMELPQAFRREIFLRGGRHEMGYGRGPVR